MERQFIFFPDIPGEVRQQKHFDDTQKKPKDAGATCGFLPALHRATHNTTKLFNLLQETDTLSGQLETDIKLLNWHSGILSQRTILGRV